MLHKYVFVIALFITVFFTAQEISYSWYDTDNVLPQNSVKDMIRDKYGFIWISTENGLIRYDGNKFLQYENITGAGKRLSPFFGSVEDDNILTHDSNFDFSLLIKNRTPIKTKYSPQKVYKDNFLFRNFNLIELAGNPPKEQEGIYIKVAKNKTYYINTKKFWYSKNACKKMVPIKVDVRSLHNFFTIDSLLCYFKNGIITIIREGEIVKQLKKRIFEPNKSKVYWSANNKQAFLISKNRIFSIALQNNDVVLEKIIDLSFIKKDLSTISSIYLDKNFGKLFIGTTTFGLLIINLPIFYTNKPVSAKTADNVFYSSIPEDSNHVVTPNGKVIGINGCIKDYKFEKSYPYNIQRDNKGNLFTIEYGTTTCNKIAKYFKNTNYKKKQDYKISNLHITTLVFGRKRQYIGIRRENLSGILNIYSNYNFKDLNHQYNFPTEVISTHEIDSNNILVACKKGLYKVSLQKNIVKELMYNKDFQIRGIARTKNEIWILTMGNGFFLLKNNRLLPMPIDSKQKLKIVHSILEDKNGFLWLSTNNGLYQVYKEELLKYSRNPLYKVHYFTYKKNDGFNTNEFNGGGIPSGSILENGHFVFPSLNGFVFFQPEKVQPIYAKEFYIGNIKFYDRRSNFTRNSINLSNNFYKAEVNIDVPYYGKNENLILEARIENSPKEEWQTITDRKFLIVSLEPGEYFLVIRMLKSKNGEYIYKKIPITVEYLFYQTLAFKALSCLFVSILIFIIVKSRIKKQKRINIELEKIIVKRTEKLLQTIEQLKETKEKLRKESLQQKKLLETISHDIISPAKYLSITAKKLYETNGYEHYKQRKYFEALYKSSEEFYNFIVTLKNYAKIYQEHNSDDDENFSLKSIIDQKILLFDQIAQDNHVIIETHINENFILQNSKDIISIIIHNLIDNALKNTSCGKITITAIDFGKEITIKISDTGSGMTEKQMEYYELLQDNIENEKLILQKYGLGLHLIIQLLQIINGRIVFEKNIPKGTNISIIIKSVK